MNILESCVQIVRELQDRVGTEYQYLQALGLSLL